MRVAAATRSFSAAGWQRRLAVVGALIAGIWLLIALIVV